MSTPRTRTFSFLECTVLLLLVAAGATVAIPQWTSERLLTNEEEATRVLRRIVDAQDAFHARNGTFGLLEELTGSRSAREVRTLPCVLPMGVPEQRAIEHHGYLFAVHLVTPDGQSASGPAAPDAHAAKTFWIAYAWPSQYGITGRSVFAVTQAGEIWRQENAVHPFSGRDAAPPVVLLAPRLGPGNPVHKPAAWVKRLRWLPVP